MSYLPKFEREKQLKRKKHQRYLVNAGGALALGAGAARVPGATKTVSRYSKPLARSGAARRLAGAAETWTPRSNALAASGGAVGAASSLNWGRQLKTDIKAEEKKLGIAKRATTTTKLGIAKASRAETRQRRQSLTAAGVTGAGASTAALGALAGGVPKGKIDPAKPNIRGATGGGILGFRQAVHRRARNDIAGEVKNEAGRWANSQTEEFMRHRKKGKLGPERTIIRHMGRGQRMGRAAMYGGAAVAGAGALGVARSRRRTSYDRPRSPFEVRKAVRRVDPRDYQGREERSGARTVGGGLGTAAAAGGTAGVLNRQTKKWKSYEQRSLKRAGELVPGLKGMKSPATGSDYHGVGERLANHPQTEKGWSQVRAAGRHHGRATQAKYFSGVYGRNAKVFGGVAAAGAGTAAYGAYKMRRNRPYGRAELSKRAPRYGAMSVVGKRDSVAKKRDSVAKKRDSVAKKRDNDELGRKIGAATNTAGAIAGPAALYGAVKSRKEGGVPRGFTRDFGNSKWGQRKAPKAAARARQVARYLDSPKSKPARVAAGVAGATAIGLQSANWAGDAIAARTLSKQPVSKASAAQRKRKAQRRAHEAQRAKAAARAPRPDPVPDNVKLGGPTKSASATPPKPMFEPLNIERANIETYTPEGFKPKSAKVTATPKRAVPKGKIGAAVGAAGLAGVAGADLYRRRRAKERVGKSELTSAQAEAYTRRKTQRHAFGEGAGRMGVIGGLGAAGVGAERAISVNRAVRKPGYVEGSVKSGPFSTRYKRSTELVRREIKLPPAKARFEARNALRGNKAVIGGGLAAAATGAALMRNQRAKRNAAAKEYLAARRAAGVSKRRGEDPVGRGANVRSVVDPSRRWRGHVSDDAKKGYRSLGRMETGALGGAISGGIVARQGAKQIFRDNPSWGGKALARQQGKIAVGTIGAVGGAKAAHGLYERRRKIRARGYQRREESLEKLAKMLKPPKPPKPVSPGRLKPTSGMKQRSFTRSSTVRTNPSGTMSSVNGTTR